MMYSLTNEKLYEKTRNYDFTSEEISAKELADNMKMALIKHGGVGLAANQVGLPYSVFVMGDANQPNSVTVVFNPIITYMSDDTTYMDEGCLSFPGIIVKKKRSRQIRVRFYDENGVLRTKVYSGMTARIFQHEYDHLQGLTLFDGLSKMRLNMILKKAKKKGLNVQLKEI